MPSNQTSPLTRYVTVADVAASLGCSDDHVRRLINDGTFPYIDISRPGAKTRRPKIRIPAAAVERHLAKLERRAPRAGLAAISGGAS